MWTCPHSDSRPAPRRRAASTRGGRCAPRRDAPARTPAAPDARTWRSGHCRARRGHRNLQQHIAALAPGFIRPLAMPAAFGLIFGIEAEVHQRVVTLAGFHDDVAALAAISAGGSAAGNEFFPPEGHAAIAAVAGLDPNCGLVNEHERKSLVVRRSSLA